MKLTGIQRLTMGIVVVTALLTSPSALAIEKTGTGETEVYYDTQFKTSNVGRYEIEVESHEVPSYETLPIISSDYFPSSKANFITEVDNTAPSAVYKANTVSKVDVVFALGKLSQSDQLQNYIPTFTNRLNSAGNGIDAVVEQVETQDIDFSSEFLWNFVINGRTEQMSSGVLIGNRPECGIDGKISAYGDTLTFYGYGSSPIYDYALFPSQSDGKLVIEFTIREVNADWHTLAHSGFNFGCAPGNPNSGYSVSFSRSSIHVRGNGIDTSVSRPSGSAFTIKAVVDPKAGTIDVSVNGNSVLSKQNVVFAGSQFGPFVQWGSHGCSSQSVVQFSGIKMQIDSKKSLGEALQNVSWRDGSARFVIHATDDIPEECQPNKESSMAYTVTKIMNSNAYLINLGTGYNKAALDSLLNSIIQADGTIKGTYYDNYPIVTAMNKSANYIIDIAKNLSKPTDWVLVNTEIMWNTEYKDNERDLPLNFGEHDGTRQQPQDTFDLTLASSWGTPLTHLYTGDKISAERWRYRHSPTFFDNSNALADFDSIWISDPIPLFELPGKYRVNYKRIDNPSYPNSALTDSFNEYRYWSTNYDKRTSFD